MHKNELNEEEMGGEVSAKEVFFTAWEKTAGSETQLRQYMVFGGHDMRVIQNDGSMNSVIY